MNDLDKSLVEAARKLTEKHLKGRKKEHLSDDESREVRLLGLLAQRIVFLNEDREALREQLRHELKRRLASTLGPQRPDRGG